MPKAPNQGERTVLRNLIAAIIAVNSYSLRKALDITSEGRPLDWVNDGEMSVSPSTAFEIKTQIMNSGYDRGDYVALLLGQRIRACLDFIHQAGSSDFFALILESKDVAMRELPKLPGVGPKVAKNFIELQVGPATDLTT